MRRVVVMVYIAPIMLFLLASLLFAGCGSADNGDYQREVSALNKEAAEKLEEALHLLGEESHGEEGTSSESVVASLEEAALIMQEALTVLEEIKVPAGWEEYHRDLASFYHANLAAYEGYLAALAPGEEHAEGAEEGNVEEENTESHEEETASEEEAPHEEETPQQEEEPAESGGH